MRKILAWMLVVMAFILAARKTEAQASVSLWSQSTRGQQSFSSLLAHFEGDKLSVDAMNGVTTKNAETILFGRIIRFDSVEMVPSFGAVAGGPSGPALGFYSEASFASFGLQSRGQYTQTLKRSPALFQAEDLYRKNDGLMLGIWHLAEKDQGHARFDQVLGPSLLYEGAVNIEGLIDFGLYAKFQYGFSLTRSANRFNFVIGIF